jgi:predicted alpha-1,2-mannosidase
MIKKIFLILGVATSSCAHKDPIAFVNPHIGSKGHGHVFVGANVPFGAVQLGPSQIMRHWDEFSGWDWTSGYNYISEEILGFTHTHLSGTGIGDLNDILLLPATGRLQVEPMQIAKPETGYGSPFSEEKVSPGFYSVYLDKYKVHAELTTTERVGLHRYSFESTDNPHVLVDLKFGMGWDAPTDTRLEKVNDTLWVGHRFSTGWAKDQRVYFALTTSVPIKNHALYEEKKEVVGQVVSGKASKGILFLPSGTEEVLVKVAISPVSSENALLNLRKEVPHWNFELTRQDAERQWAHALNKVSIHAEDSIKTIFYTALYHTQFAPTLFNDVNGDYRGSDKKVVTKANFQTYTTFSLWDTYRALHPLHTLLYPEKSSDFVNSLLAITEEQNALAMWPLQGSETFTMVGNPAMIVIADAHRKNLIPLATAYKAYETLYKVSNVSTVNEMPLYQKYVRDLTWIPADSLKETVAWAMEYAVADGAMADLAHRLGQKDAGSYYDKRAGLYAKYFDASTGFFRGRNSDSTFRVPFDPFQAKHRANDYIEGNAWQYLWMVPHQVPKLIQLMGGEKAFVQKLDQFFTAEESLGEEASHDITGLIGQYAHGNEPSHHIAYLYAYAGRSDKTADRVREIVQRFYNAGPEGLVGNEDVGQMSAWYVWSALGLYPANPNSAQFVFGSPIVDSALFKLRKDKNLKINTKNNSAQNRHIQTVTWNGKPYRKLYISYEELAKGGELEFTMGPLPCEDFLNGERPR